MLVPLWCCGWYNYIFQVKYVPLFPVSSLTDCVPVRVSPSRSSDVPGYPRHPTTNERKQPGKLCEDNTHIVSRPSQAYAKASYKVPGIIQTCKVSYVLVQDIIFTHTLLLRHNVIPHTCKLAVNPSGFAELGNPGISSSSSDSGLSAKPATEKLMLQGHARSSSSSSSVCISTYEQRSISKRPRCITQ